MKKFSIFLLTIITFIGIIACEHDDDVVFVAKQDAEGISFVNSTAQSYTLTNQTASNVAERFVWSNVDFGTPTTVTYELQGSTTSDFSSFDLIGTTSENNMAVTVSQMMDLAEDAGLDNDPNTELPNAGQIYFRVRAYAGTDGSNGLQEISQPISVNVVLPEQGETEQPKVNLFFVGNATAAGWDNNNNNNPVFRDSENADLFYYTGKFTAGEFKLLEERGLWQPQWGTNEAGTISVNPGDTEDPGSFVVDTEGYYTYIFNLDEMTFTQEAFDESSATTYEVIGLVGAGSSVGWPGDDNPTPDIQLTQSSFDEHIWFAESVTLTDGPVKFRANLAWDTNWGAEAFPSGDGEGNGPDIMAEEGNYEVWFNDLTGRYIFISLDSE